MMRSMFASVSGLRAQQTKMDVIGNNIANLNTIAYRGSRVTFQEVFSQTMKGAGAPDNTTGRGGTNPIQVGLGMGVGAVDIITTRGSLQRTDSPTDVSIEGDGFFIVKGSKADTFKFTRAGNFGVDKLGNLVSGEGMNVYGWQDYGGKANSDGTYIFDTDKQIEPLNLYSDVYNKNKKIIAAKATSEAVLAGNIDASKPKIATTDASQYTVPINVYDNLGNEYKVNIAFRKTDVDPGNSTTWTWSIPDGSGFTSSSATGEIKFDAFGQIIEDTSAVPTITLTPDDTTGTAAFDMKLDFTKLTMYSADSSIKPISIDGYPTGSLVTFNVGSDGIITGVYSNGKQKPLGLIAMAGFDNPAGLQRAGNNMYIPTPNSGDFKRAFKAGSEGVGTLNPGTLEMSNVDLAKEFTEMIVTQRGFQANSRIMTTVDEMLQEMANMKR